MLKFSDLRLMRGSRVLIDALDLFVHADKKVGFCGANGSGKSSLFALIRGELTPDTGTCEMSASTQLAYVAQETPALTQCAVDYVVDGHRQLRALEAALSDAPLDDMHAAQCHAELAELNPERIQAQATKMLVGLGFSQAECEKSVSAFSGGWRMRLNLAQALIQPADILLLDEPTNHLDLEAIVWLEQFIQHYPGTVLIISHDRAFLDNTVGEILWLANQTITQYSGNYSTFEKSHALQLENQQKAFDKQQKSIAHMQKYIDKFRYKASKARQAQSRLKALERMEKVSAVIAESPFTFEFFEPEKLADPILQLKNFSFGFDDKPIFKNQHLILRANSRVALLGTNGAGKSTLLKILSGDYALTNGEREIPSQKVRVAYFAQHQVDTLNLTASPLEHIRELDKTVSEQAIRNFLGGFNFSGDATLSSIEHFSGGEKARLALALIVWKKPHILLMDEPTNHLDMAMREALERALQFYTGALVVVSHDRHFIDTTVDELLLVADQKITLFNGDLKDYSAQSQTVSSATKTASSNKNRYQLKNQLQKLERQLSTQQEKLKVLDDKLADAKYYQVENQAALTKLQAQRQKAIDKIVQIESDWLDIMAQLES